MFPCLSSRNSISFLHFTSSGKYFSRNASLNTAQEITTPVAINLLNISCCHRPKDLLHTLEPSICTIRIIPTLEHRRVMPHEPVKSPLLIIVIMILILSSLIIVSLHQSLSYSSHSIRNRSIISSHHLALLHNKQTTNNNNLRSTQQSTEGSIYHSST